MSPAIELTLRGRRFALRPWLAVGIIYLAARLITTVFVLIGVALVNQRTGGDASLGSLLMRWDGQWYWVVGSEGYPTELPRDEDGLVTQNAWAFLPLYPAVTRAVSVLLGGQYPAAAMTVAIVAGYFSSLALYHLLRERIPVDAALWAVALYAAGPLAALFQMGYAEGMFLLWLFLALRMLIRRSYGWLYALIPLMGFTRPGVLAFALLLGLYGITRWVRRGVDPLPVREIVHIVALGLLAVAVGFAWQLIAAWVTGDSSAYLETELAWRRGWTGAAGGFTPFEGFVQASVIWFRVWGLPPGAGPVVLVAVVAALALVLLFEPHVRKLGVELRLWSASYVLYLLAVFFPQSSIFRLLLPLAPLNGAVALPRSAPWRVGALLVGLLAQWWWIDQMLVQGTTYAQIP